MRFVRHALFAAILGLFAGAANAYAITFDESPAADSGVAFVGPVDGDTFSASNAGTWGGLSRGNPGSWGLNGPVGGGSFLGFNGGGGNAGYSETVTFGSIVDSVSAEFSRSGGSSDGTIVMNAYDGTTLLGSTSVVLGAINTWSTLSLSYSDITSISWVGTGTSFHPYGVDNIVVGTVPVPEPSTSALLGLAGIALVCLRKRA